MWFFLFNERVDVEPLMNFVLSCISLSALEFIALPRYTVVPAVVRAGASTLKTAVCARNVAVICRRQHLTSAYLRLARVKLLMALRLTWDGRFVLILAVDSTSACNVCWCAARFIATRRVRGDTSRFTHCTLIKFSNDNGEYSVYARSSAPLAMQW